MEKLPVEHLYIQQLKITKGIIDNLLETTDSQVMTGQYLLSDRASRLRQLSILLETVLTYDLQPKIIETRPFLWQKIITSKRIETEKT